jgi:hypothetical protein
VLERLRRHLGQAGLNLALPLSAAAFDAACAPVSPVRLAQLYPQGKSALLVGSAGRVFFDRFWATTGGGDGQSSPLDRFTRAAVEGALTAALRADDRGEGQLSLGYRILFPFVDSQPPLPFQRLGQAAGLGAPGPLGIQIHPRFGPWWAYRALIILDALLPEESAVGDGCAGCDAPCTAACPAHAVAVTGFGYAACGAHRLEDPACHFACAARSRCIRGPEHAYSARQLAFHMSASMPAPLSQLGGRKP